MLFQKTYNSVQIVFKDKFIVAVKKLTQILLLQDNNIFLI
jgi:hypothetical protein